MRIILTILFLSGAFLANAQPYVKGGKTRHRFAQLNIGLDALYAPGKNTRTLKAENNGSGGSWVRTSLQNLHQTRAIIGGTHFWGHADFFVAFPVVSNTSYFLTGIETGAKIYPARIEHGKVRPYAGVSLAPTSFRQNEGAQKIKMSTPLLGGLTYNNGKHILDIGVSFVINNSFDYYVSPYLQTHVKPHRYWVTIGYRYMLETTLSAEKQWKSGYTERKTDSLSRIRGRLNGFTVAAGPSTAFNTKKSSYNNARPYLGRHKLANVFMDLAIGYYLHKPDVQFNISYRKNKSFISAFGDKQQFTRESVAFEAYKFMGDYHGFVPFIGTTLNYENLEMRESGLQAPLVIEKKKMFKPGIVFGWDIRPNSLQKWLLRTNLRYTPGLTIQSKSANASGELSFDQLEFNIIQLVIFPERLFGMKKL